MIVNACDGSQADITALYREPFHVVLDRIERWLRSAIAMKKATEKRK